MQTRAGDSSIWERNKRKIIQIKYQLKSKHFCLSCGMKILSNPADLQNNLVLEVGEMDDTALECKHIYVNVNIQVMSFF